MDRARLAPLLIVLALAGCTGGRPAVAEHAGVRALIGADTHGAGNDAQVFGRVLLTDGRCLGLEAQDGRPMLLVWPHGVSQLTDGRTGVDVPDVGAIVVGDFIEAGGGYMTPPVNGFEPQVVADCAAGYPEVAIIDVASTLRPVPAPTPTPRGVRAFVAPPDAASAGPILGELVPTEGRCLAVAVGGQPYVVVWPDGVTPTDDGVDVPGVGRMYPGDVLRATGDYRHPPDVGDVVPPDCWPNGHPGGVAVVGTLESISRGP